MGGGPQGPEGGRGLTRASGLLSCRMDVPPPPGRTAGGRWSEATLQVWPWEGCPGWGRGGGFRRRAGWTWEVGVGSTRVCIVRVHMCGP